MTHWIDFQQHKKFQDISLSGANNDANHNHVNCELYLYDVLTYISRVCISEQKHRIHTGLCENCLRFLDELRGSVFAITHKCDLPTNWRKWFEIRKELLIKCIWLCKLSAINVLVAVWSPSLPFTCGSTFNLEQNTESLQDLEYRLAALHFRYYGGKCRFNQRWANQSLFFAFIVLLYFNKNFRE